MAPRQPNETQARPGSDELLARMAELGPWHIEVRLSDTLSTRDAWEADRSANGGGGMGMYNPEPAWSNLLRSIYPRGLRGRSVLDCACNCGAYSFAARDLGAGSCFGFDAREHWIEQARFLREFREAPSDGMRFEVVDLYDLPSVEAGPFDVTFFLGIFYHLPDPVSGLRLVADMTRELIILDTATQNDMPDGSLFAAEESATKLLSGTYGLNWLPTGPETLRKIFNWLGFEEMRVIYRRRDTVAQPPHLGRLRVAAARDKSVFKAFDAAAGG